MDRKVQPNKTLATLHDTLLPKLLSGELPNLAQDRTKQQGCNHGTSSLS